MPIPSVVMHRRVHLGAKEENRRRDVKVKEQREGDAQASVDNAVVGEVRQVERETSEAKTQTITARAAPGVTSRYL